MVRFNYKNKPLKQLIKAIFLFLSGVNFLDLSIRQGQFDNLPKLPFVPGFECAGDIVQLGPNTTGYQVSLF